MPQQTFTIGRSPECDVVIADGSVSRRHAEIVVTERGELFLIDCRSTQGTRIAHRGATRAITQDFVPLDAEVQFGDVTLPVGEVLAGIRAARPDAVLPASPAAAPPSVPSSSKPRTWVRGAQLVRCGCGAVKIRDQHCQECGA